MQQSRKYFMKYLLLLLTTIFCTNIFATPTVQNNLEKLEKSFDGKIGVYAIDTNNNQIIAYRADERFPVQSTCKLLGTAALFKQNNSTNNLLQKKISITKNDLMFWHPITGKYINNSMTLKALAEAAISYSDNPAMNLIIKQLGGPEFITNFAHSIGNTTFNIKHYEGNLNSNPNIQDDTATPKDMAISLQKLTLGNLLEQPLQTKLVTWMKNSTTGYKRMRAGVPMGWTVADKTGSGDYGVANDIGILWSPVCKPVVLAIYTIQNNQNAKSRDDIVATTTKIIFDELAKTNSCINGLMS